MIEDMDISYQLSEYFGTKYLHLVLNAEKSSIEYGGLLDSIIPEEEKVCKVPELLTEI